MNARREELQAILAELLAASEDSRTLSLDAIGEAVSAMAIGADEIDQLFDALEAAGRTVLAPEAVDLPSRLRAVLGAARALGAELGRRPRLEEVAARAGLTAAETRHALSYGRVLGR